MYKTVFKYLKRSRGCLSMIWHRSEYVNHVSYYPECAHKTSFQILKDQLYYIWKYGYIEEYYFTCGFDRKEMTQKKMGEYITPYRLFLHRINHLNCQNPYYDDFNAKMTCRVINQDKFYFYLFLSQLNIPTPKVYCFIKNKTVLYADDSFKIDPCLSTEDKLHAIFANDMDAFAKPSDGMLGKGAFKLVIKDGSVFINGVQKSIDELVETILSADYIIQERIVQHEKGECSLHFFCQYDTASNSHG